jgi:hypothetical protein
MKKVLIALDYNSSAEKVAEAGIKLLKQRMQQLQSFM